MKGEFHLADIDTVALAKARTAATKKHIELNQLRIVKEYIDNKDNLAMNSEEGVHNIRYFNNKLQYKGDDGNWTTISTGTVSGSGEGGLVTTEDMADSVFASDEEVSDMFNF